MSLVTINVLALACFLSCHFKHFCTGFSKIVVNNNGARQLSLGMIDVVSASLPIIVPSLFSLYSLFSTAHTLQKIYPSDDILKLSAILCGISLKLRFSLV